MSEGRLTCAEVREEKRRRQAKILKHERAIDALQERCLHDETKSMVDYQDPKPYRVCLGCGRSLP